MTCRKCVHYDVKPDADGKVRMRRHSVARCTAPVDLPALLALLPASCDRIAQDIVRSVAPNARQYTDPDDGAGCHLFTKKPKA